MFWYYRGNKMKSKHYPSEGKDVSLVRAVSLKEMLMERTGLEVRLRPRPTKRSIFL